MQCGQNTGFVNELAVYKVSLIFERLNEVLLQLHCTVGDCQSIGLRISYVPSVLTVMMSCDCRDIIQKNYRENSEKF
jgi:hypothetical protein